MIPNPNGSFRNITLEHLETDRKMLGVWDDPLGGNKEHYQVIHNRMEFWFTRVKNGRLPVHEAYLGYKLQLWAGLHYGIGTMTNKFKQVRDALANLD